MSSPDRIISATKFVEGMLSREAAYHQHKESAAYAAITLFAGAVASAAISDAWPPAWGTYTNVLAVFIATVVWAAVLVFLRFQLTRRRWAAMRVAACERLLAEWIQRVPSDVELARRPAGIRAPVHWSNNLVNLLWGDSGAVRAVDVGQSVYPAALVEELLAQEKRPTGALQHERLILLSGWVLYLVFVAASCLKLR